MSPARPVVRSLGQAGEQVLAPGVTTVAMLNDEHGCRGLHQHRVRVTAGATANGTAGGFGESWYVISGSGRMEVDGDGELGSVPLRAGTAVWLRRSVNYRCLALAGEDLELLAITVRAGGTQDAGPAFRAVTLDSCAPERAGDREFRVLLSAGLSITQFAGMIPPGRARAHHHAYDEVVHVLDGQGVVHLGDAESEIGPGTSIYLPPYQPHCLENTGSRPLQVLGVFYPAGSPAAKQEES